MIKVNVEINNKFWNKKIKQPKKYFIKKLETISKNKQFLKKKNLIFTILLTNSLNMQKLNKKFRNKNKATDVLSFPQLTKKELKTSKKENLYIGDIAVSYDIINDSAKKSNFFFEFDRVWIHGFLHLLGYDHKKNKDYFKMNKLEISFLKLIS